MINNTTQTRSVRQVISKITDVVFYGWLAFCAYRVFIFWLGTNLTKTEGILMAGIALMLIAIRVWMDNAAEVEDDDEDGYWGAESKDDYDLCS